MSEEKLPGKNAQENEGEKDQGKTPQENGREKGPAEGGEGAKIDDLFDGVLETLRGVLGADVQVTLVVRVPMDGGVSATSILTNDLDLGETLEGALQIAQAVAEQSPQTRH